MSYDYVKLTQLNTDDGLNQNTISALLQDHQGYLWIGTLEGINRYDGYRISSIESPDEVLSRNYVNYIYQDSSDLIWIGSSDNSNFTLDKSGNQLKLIDFPQSEKFPEEYPIISYIVEDKDNNLWVATAESVYFYDRSKGALEFKLNIKQLFSEPKLTEGIRSLLLLDKQLLVATTRGLYLYDTVNDSNRLVQHAPKAGLNENKNDVKSLLLNEKGEILIGAVEGLYKFSQNNLLSETSSEKFIGEIFVKHLNIWQLIEKSDFYWMATDRGLYKLLKDGSLNFIFKYSDTPFHTSDDDIVNMIEDNEGTLWFGSRADGVFKWHPNNAIKSHHWNKGPPSQQLSHLSVYSVHKTEDDKIWIGTQNGLNIIDPKTSKVEQLMVNPDEKAVYSKSTIYQVVSNNNNVWLNTDEGLVVLDQNTKEPANIVFPETDDDLFKGPIYDIYFLDQRSLAITNEDGIYIYDLQANEVSLLESTKTDGDEKLGLYTLFDTATGDRSTYYVAAYNRLATLDRSTGKVETFHALPKSDKYRSSPNDLYRDGNRLWLTYPGIGIYVLDADTGEEIHFFSEEKLKTNSIMDIFPDKNNNLWFSSNEGLLRVNKSTFSSLVFDSSDGFATSEFNGASSLKLDNGEVYLGSVKGVFRFNPNDISSFDNREISNRITHVSLLSKKIPGRYDDYNDYPISMTHDDFGLQVEFSALLLNKPKQVRYYYWFDGDSATEKTLIDESKLFLPKIAEGHSTLNISAVDYETGKESLPAKLPITSLPPPWRSKEAYSGYIILALLIFWLSYHTWHRRAKAKIRAHRILRQSEERLNLALIGGDSGLWDWHANHNRIYEPRLQGLPQDQDGNISFKERLETIHSDDRLHYKSTWLEFLSDDSLKTFDETFRMQNEKGDWRWYRDMATVSEKDEKGNPIRITGTYSDITERKQARDKMRLFSTAFENTRDIVFVLNNQKLVIAANQAFYKTTGFDSEQIISGPLNFIVDNLGSRKLTASIFKNIHQHEHWEGEALLKRAQMDLLPVIITATRFFDSEDNEHFVFALTDITKQKKAENELRVLANYDSLTGLPNRALLLDRISHAIEHCRRRNRIMALFFIDLDRFKHINDTLGHDIGDLLLVNVAKTLSSTIRQDDTVARLGGDEFVIMLEELETVESISRIAQNIIDIMQTPMQLQEHQISVSPSIGIAIFPDDGVEAKLLLKHADIAMYHAKNAGRNNFQFFENSMNHLAKARLDLENKLKEAVSNEEFYLVYQPQYDLASGQLIGVEALARWQTKDGEHISPANFIPVAEDLGLIIPMTESLFRRALSNLSRWHQDGKAISLAFNLSARQLHHYDFVGYVEKQLAEFPVQAHLLEFELTESVLMHDVDKVNRIFGKLAEIGIDLALDDFGTGYSSLKYLNQLPLNKLKIDRSFVSKINVSEECNAIIRTIISLAKTLNLTVLAEGVETQEQLEFLTQSGAQQAQGFYLAKPLTLEKLETLFEHQLNPIDTYK